MPRLLFDDHRSLCRLLAAFCLCGWLSGCGVPTGDESQKPAAPDVKWFTTYDEALAEAKSSGKPVLVDFTGSDWCGPCKMLKRDVFETPEFKKWADKKVVLLELDYPRFTPDAKDVARRNAPYLQQYHVTAFPTVLFLNAEGNVYGRSMYEGESPTLWLKKADKILQRTIQSKSASNAPK